MNRLFVAVSVYLAARYGAAPGNRVFPTLRANSGVKFTHKTKHYKKEDFNDKPYYFILEAAYSKIGVTIN